MFVKAHEPMCFMECALTPIITSAFAARLGSMRSDYNTEFVINAAGSMRPIDRSIRCRDHSANILRAHSHMPLLMLCRDQNPDILRAEIEASVQSCLESVRSALESVTGPTTTVFLRPQIMEGHRFLSNQPAAVNSFVVNTDVVSNAGLCGVVIQDRAPGELDEVAIMHLRYAILPVAADALDLSRISFSQEMVLANMHPGMARPVAC